MSKYLADSIGGCIMIIISALIITSCGKEEDLSGGLSNNYRLVDIPVEMNIVNFQNEEVTRTEQAPLPGDLGQEENAIHNITVFQFDGNGDDTDQLIVLRYVDTGLDNLTLGLMQPKSNPNKNQFVYCVANADRQLQDFSGTYGELKTKLIPVNNLSISDGVMIFTASIVTPIDALKDIRISFIRKLAKVNVRCSIASDISFSPTRLQLRNVAKSLSLMNITEKTPSASMDNFQNYMSVTENITKGYTWYIPENRRGTGNATDPKNKIAATAPTGQGDYCTYVELSGLYQEGSVSKLVSYRVYLGENNTDDYNVKSNYVYNVNISVFGVNENDLRVTAETLPMAKTPANCYMVSPGDIVIIDLFTAPGTPVANSGVDYTTRMGNVSDSKIKSIGIVWQTENTPDGLIQDLSFLGVKGQAMFKVTPDASGNLLLGAYSESKQQGSILWSWHIWVTDYAPGTGTVTGNVTGGKVHVIDNVVWMDRDLGALSATKGPRALGYAYQWGRKDPFPMTKDTTGFVPRPLYDSNGANLQMGVVAGDRDPTDLLIDKSINEPWIFYTNKVGKNYWWGGNNANLLLWSDTEKTMYDPCPAGWRLPTGTIARNMNGNNMTQWNLNNHGAFFKGVSWYQYYGYLDYQTGTNGQPASTTGVYWTSTIKRMYQPVATGISSDSRDCRYGFIGRCVKE